MFILTTNPSHHYVLFYFYLKKNEISKIIDCYFRSTLFKKGTSTVFF